MKFLANLRNLNRRGLQPLVSVDSFGSPFASHLAQSSPWFTTASNPGLLNRRIAHCRSHCLFRKLPPPGLVPPLGAAGLRNPFRQPRPPSLHPSIWLNRRAAALPFASLVSPDGLRPSDTSLDFLMV